MKYLDNEGCMPGSPTDVQESNTPESTSSGIEGSNNTPVSPTANEDADAGSSTAEKGVKESLVDRIKAVTDRISGEESPTSESKEGEVTDPDAKPESEATEEEDKPFTKDDLGNLHSKTRKRVGKLLANVETLTHEVNTLKPAADEYGKITQFLRENDISNDDADAAFQVLRDIRRDPMRALEMLEPVVQNLRMLTGAILPEDLHQQVRDGYITETHAQELARHRAMGMHQQTIAQEQQARAQRQEMESQVQNVTSIQKSISDWESKWASTDPDYAKKQSEVHELFELELSRASKNRTLPKTPEEAVKLITDCRKRVESRYSRYQPQKQEIRHVTGSSAGTNKPRPQTSVDAILNAVNG
jgi:hypothetical protein